MRKYNELTILILSVFFLQNCMTIFRGSSQSVPITSDPTGATIIVDGKERGQTPLSLRLKRKANHILRIEKQGYNPLEIRVASNTSAGLSILGNMVWGLLAAFPGAVLLTTGGLAYMFSGDEEAEDTARIGAVLSLTGLLIGWGGAVALDYSSGANYRLGPSELNATLTKNEGEPQQEILHISSDEFQAVKWIRIKCDDSEGEDEIVNLDTRD